MSNRDWAAFYAEVCGWPVFPCISDAEGRALQANQRKRPACSGGFHAATLDVNQINILWSNPAYNVGFPPDRAGIVVFDQEYGGERAWATFKQAHNLPDTFTVKTPRGGKHFYYHGSAPTKKLVPGLLETRGQGAYVVLPPSTISGSTYEVIDDRPIAQLPDGIAELAPRGNQPVAVPDPANIDNSGAIDRARALLIDYVSRGNVAVEGQAGDIGTYQVACDVQDLGCDEQTTYSLMLELWNPHCWPPWPDEELWTKVQNARKYRQNPVGIHATAPAEQVFTRALTVIREAPTADKPLPWHKWGMYFLDEAAQDQLPDPTWLFENLVPDRASILWLAWSGNFKSYIKQHLDFSIAANVPCCFGMHPQRTGPVVYATNEGLIGLARSRRKAWRLANNIEKQIPFWIIKAPKLLYPDMCDAFLQGLKWQQDLWKEAIISVTLDTYSKAMFGLDENSNVDAGKFVAFANRIQEEIGCSIHTVHHLGKDEAKLARGSSVLTAGFDTTILIKRVPNSLQVSVKILQHKDADVPEQPYFLEGKKLAGALVFQKIDAPASKPAAAADNPFAGSKVGKALRELRALNGSGVTTHILGRQICLQGADEGEDHYEERLNKACRTLNALAKGSLAGYAEKSDREWRWALPAE